VEKITPSIIILLVIIITVKTNVDRSNTYSVTEISQYNNSVKEYEDVYLKVDPRSKISKSLSVNNSELIMIEDRSCGVSGSLENRKRLRWVIRANELKLYKYIYQNVSNIAPYYFYIVYHSLIIFISFLIIGEIVPLNNLQKVLYICCVMYIFQFQLSEITYSVHELLLMSMALLASYKKKSSLLIFTVLVAIHNRESGVVLSFVWILFNTSWRPIIMSLILSISIWLGVTNFDIINCVFSNNFLISNKPQIGQIGMWSIFDGSVSVISFVRILVEGYVIPFLIIYCFYKTNYMFNRKLLIGFVLTYLLIFLVATPLLHHSVKLLLIPFMLILSSEGYKCSKSRRI